MKRALVLIAIVGVVVLFTSCKSKNVKELEEKVTQLEAQVDQLTNTVNDLTQRVEMLEETVGALETQQQAQSYGRRSVSRPSGTRRTTTKPSKPAQPSPPPQVGGR